MTHFAFKIMNVAFKMTNSVQQTADCQRLVLRTVADESVDGMDFPTVAGLVSFL